MYVLILLPVVAVVLLVYYTYSIQMAPRNMPPGPFVLPFGLGSVPAGLWRRPVWRFWKVQPWHYFNLLAEEYGGIVGASFGNFNVLILNTYDAMNEVANLDEYGNKFASKVFTFPRSFGKELGLLFVESPHIWKEMRKFSSRVLRDFGFGKQYTMQSVIVEEANLVADAFTKVIKEESGVTRIRNSFSLTVLNVLWCMVAGVRYEHGDPRLVKLMQSLFNGSKLAQFSNPMELILPYLNYVAPWAAAPFGMDYREKVFAEMHEYSKRLIEERKIQGFYLSEPESYVDVFLRKIYDHQDKPDSVYSEQQLQMMIEDFLAVGSLTLNATLSYGILYLLLNPEMQKKIQDDIDSVIPRTMAPTAEDIEKMHYFQAFVLELHRCASVIPTPIPRVVPKHWKFRGYDIPKGALIVSNHYGANMLKSEWGDPDTFRPERFLNENNEYVFDPRVTYLGFGKRICLGAPVVEAVVPLYLVTLIQKFTFSVVPGTAPPSTEPEVGISLSPIEFQVMITPRDETKVTTT